MMAASAPIVDLSGKRGLVAGIANEHGIAAGSARSFALAGRIPRADPDAGSQWDRPL